MIAGTSLLLAGIGWLLPRLPFSLVGIPHPDYWLAPERRAGSWLLIQDFLLVVTAATNLFFVLLLRETVIANRLPQPHLGAGFWLIMAAYVALLAAGTIRWLRWWRLPR